MAKAKTPAIGKNHTLLVEEQSGKTEARNLADVSLDPAAHGMAAARLYNKGTFGEQSLTDTYQALTDHVKAAAHGDLSHQRAMLAAQADALNAIFTEMARRAAVNMGEHINATQLYLRLGLKAQTQCRATIEALDRLANGHVQTVKHVHINEGGQAVIADQFHHHAGGGANAESDEQSHEQRACGFPLFGEDPFGHPLPAASDERQATLSPSWRD
jgi:hypothetical protein